MASGFQGQKPHNLKPLITASGVQAILSTAYFRIGANLSTVSATEGFSPLYFKIHGNQNDFRGLKQAKSAGCKNLVEFGFKQISTITNFKLKTLSWYILGVE